MSTTETRTTATQWIFALLRDDEPFEHIPSEPALALSLLRELLTAPYAALSSLDDPACGAALNSLVAAWHTPNLMGIAVDASLPRPERVALVRAVPGLFRDVVARRLPAAQLASASRDPSLKSLANIAHMFWEYAAITPRAEDEDQRVIDAACLDAIESVLFIAHAGCQESALLGLSLWSAYPARVYAILDRWLTSATPMHPSLTERACRERAAAEHSLRPR
ncbi:MAG: hypothetical protein JNK05_36045 [Myxococcales bacterium]|nr:hypothetical protein [Myxococcales bacterium]